MISDWTPLERWALAEDLATPRTLIEVRRRVADGGWADLRSAELAAGREILAELRGRGLRLRLDEDGRPCVGPRERVRPEDLELLRAERAAVLAALRHEHEQEEGR
ncbi:MAG TPA: hypothetical protein VFA26_18530 [Gemmataceae bacterium]|nr:hypothetical protein [Gemmataceae bacterium]